MNRYTLFRNFPTRLACRVRVGVFVVVALGLGAPGVMGQKPHAAAPPPRSSFPRPAPQQQHAPVERPAQAPPQQHAPVEHPAQVPQQQQQTRPMERPVQPATNPAAGGALVNPGHPRQMQLHLGAWMDTHRNLPLAQQHEALDAEPGFRELNPAEQARLHQQLTQLNHMSPEQQQRTIQRAEIMEKLAPQQRQEVNRALGQLGSLPEDRQRAVVRAYRQLRDLPEPQRQAYMNSPQFRSQYSDQERATVGNMVNAAPLLRSFEQPVSGPPKD